MHRRVTAVDVNQSQRHERDDFACDSSAGKDGARPARGGPRQRRLSVDVTSPRLR
jgi:hypothetical protein